MKTPTKRISSKILKQLIPLRDIPIASLNRLAEENTASEYEPGRIIFRRGQTDNFIFYLLKGKLILQGQEEEEILSGGSSAALAPIDSKQPRQVTAIAKTPVIILKLNKNLIEVMSSPDTSNQEIEVDEIREDDIDAENQLAYKLYNEYLDGELQLASLPELAIRVRKAVQNPENTTHHIASIIQSDPAITGQIIKISNSPVYRKDSVITDCQSAVSRIGLVHTRDIVTSLTVKQLFKPKTKVVAKQMANLWKHSTHVAAISAVIAEMVPSMNPDRAMLAGLVHDIGTLAILTYAEQFPDLIKTPAILDDAIMKLGAQMGALVLRHWSMASDLVTVTLECEDWLRDSRNGPDLCDIVLVAQIHSYVGTPELQTVPNLVETPAFHKLPLSLGGPEKSLQILNEARDHILEMRHLLA